MAEYLRNVAADLADSFRWSNIKNNNYVIVAAFLTSYAVVLFLMIYYQPTP